MQLARALALIECAATTAGLSSVPGKKTGRLADDPFFAPYENKTP